MRNPKVELWLGLEPRGLRTRSWQRRSKSRKMRKEVNECRHLMLIGARLPPKRSEELTVSKQTAVMMKKARELKILELLNPKLRAKKMKSQHMVRTNPSAKEPLALVLHLDTCSKMTSMLFT